MDESKILNRLVQLIEQYRDTERSGKFLEYFPPDELGKLLALEKQEAQGDWDEVFHWVEKYLQYSVKTNHPGFVNRMWVGANLPSIVGEIISAIINTSACTFESAPVSTLLEKYMIDQMLELVGFKNGEGQMTTGSSNANMIAMMCARNLSLKGAKQAGLFGQQKLFGFVSAESHYSMDKAANILGIGTDQLIKISVNSSGEMSVEDLESALDRVVANGGSPFFVGATAGTTVRGAYDPIKPLLHLRDKYKFWLHVDGAWGGVAILSDSLRREFLTGIEKVDSFTYDFHKMLGTSLMCNILLLNGRSHTFGNVLSGGDGSYIFHGQESNDVFDLGAVSLQCGRKVDSLKWFLDWKFYGRKGLAERVHHYLDLCSYAEEVVVSSEHLEMVVPRESFNLCFRFKVKEDSNAFNLALREHLYQKGTSLVGEANIDSKVTLRLLITNPFVKKVDIDKFFNDLIIQGEKLLHT